MSYNSGPQVSHVWIHGGAFIPGTGNDPMFDEINLSFRRRCFDECYQLPSYNALIPGFDDGITKGSYGVRSKQGRMDAGK